MSSQKGEKLWQKKQGKRHHSVLCPLSSLAVSLSMRGQTKLPKASPSSRIEFRAVVCKTTQSANDVSETPNWVGGILKV